MIKYSIYTGLGEKVCLFVKVVPGNRVKNLFKPPEKNGGFLLEGKGNNASNLI